MSQLEQALTRHFGFSEFREGQRQAIENLLQGHSTLAVFPTGSGKSLCYQFTATQLPHLTLVVSPLIALMHDQLAFLDAKKIPAASLDSTQSKEDSLKIMQEVRNGQIKILMVSVERFSNENFRRFLASLAISMLVVDEAHCLSEWGHNFRPDYLKLPKLQREFRIPTVLLLTATATRRVQKDMAQKFAICPEHIVQTGFYRPNLTIELKAAPNDLKHTLLMNALKEEQGASIVYVTLQKTADQLAQQLQILGLQASAYHAGLDSETRSHIQQSFMSNKLNVIVATIAFGMGIDKANIRQVIHYDLPKSIENYSQEIGRAGRDNQASRCLLLANLDNLYTLENFVYADTPEAHNIEQLLTHIQTSCQHSQYNTEWHTQLFALSQLTNIRSLVLKTLLVQLELQNILQPKYSYYEQVRLKWLLAKPDVQSLDPSWHNDYQAILDCIRYKKIWGTPDFDYLEEKHAIGRGRALAILEHLNETQHISLETKVLTEVYQVNLAGLKEPNLLHNLTAYVKEKEASEIARIHTMLRFFKLDRCLSHNLARYFGDQQAPEQCGHCSVCRGSVLSFPPSNVDTTCQPTEQLQQDMQSFMALVANQALSLPITETLITRFLMGFSQPIFTPLKARKLAAYGKYEHESYLALRQTVSQLLVDKI
ncbi:RecQ family ATP-dependent DNA helicase [Marinomonas epiphytica]